MSRMMQANVIATSGRAVEAGGMDAAAGQDRHHHPWATARPAIFCRPRSERRAAGRSCTAVVLAQMKHLRKAAARWLWPGSAMARLIAAVRFPGRVRALYRTDAYEWSGSAESTRFAQLAQRAPPMPCAGMSRRWAAASRLRCNCPWTTSRARAARLWVVADGAKVLGRSSSLGHRRFRHARAFCRTAAAHGHKDG